MFKIASIPSNLFIDNPEMHDASMHRLPNDIDSWPEEIIQKLKERIPKTSGMNTMVKFMKKDEENGAATGSIVISSPNRTAIIPLIVKDFMMSPLDIIIAKQKLLPLTLDFFDSIFEDNNVFQKLEEYPTFGGLGRFEDANLWDAIYPPSLGRYAYASAGYPILDAISDDLDGSWVRTKVAEDTVAASRFYQNGHRDVLTKIADMQPVNMDEYRQGKDKLIPRTVVGVYREGANKYNILSNSDRVFHPGIDTVDRRQLHHFVSTICDKVDDTLTEVDCNGEKMLRVPEPESSVFLATPDFFPAEEANEFGNYSVRMRTGVNVEGIVIPKVITFDQIPTNLKIFKGKTVSSVQSNIAGVRVKGSRFVLNKKESPKVGQMGTFVYMPDLSHAIATIPITVKTIVDDCGKLIVKGYDFEGAPVKVKMCDSMHLERIAKLPDGSYIIPGRMFWVPLDDFQVVSSTVENYIAKAASERLTTHPIKVIYTGGNQYSLKGVDKYASAMGVDKTCMRPIEANMILSSLGAGQDKIAAALKIAKRNGHSELHGLKFTPLKSEKIAQVIPKAEKMLKFAKSLKGDFFKTASYMENSQTVDALLSLNFVNPENITKFVAKIPALKSAISNIASCVIASRLGMQEIPEDSSVTAMMRLVDVVTGLERLRASKEI